jgi:hypothetical protein
MAKKTPVLAVKRRIDLAPAAAPPSKRFADKTQLTVYLPDQAYHELRELAAELSRQGGRNVKMQDLMKAGIDAILERHGRPACASAEDAPEIV